MKKKEYDEYICLVCDNHFYSPVQKHVFFCSKCGGITANLGKKVYHYGKRLENGTAFVKKSKNDIPKQVKIPETPEEVVDIYTALAAIICRPNNLMRVSKYYCERHKKYHRYTFHQQISFTVPFMYGVDSESDVISFARTLYEKDK